MRWYWWRILAGALLAVIAVNVLPWLQGQQAEGVLFASMFPVGRLGDPMSSEPENVEPIPQATQHTVSVGETLALIALRYGVDPRQLASLNGIRNPDRIFPGQVLTIPEAKATFYTVQRGDTLSRIAKRFGVDLNELCVLNGIGDPDYIRVGQRLHIPGDVAVSDLRMAQASRFSFFIPLLSWPVIGAISSSFGWRWDRFHSGIDIATQYGTPVTACADGTVTFAGRKGNYGNLVIIEHEDGLSSYYGHLSRLEVEQGMQVLAGEVIGCVGKTGRATGPHLHFEVRKESRPINPRELLP